MLSAISGFLTPEELSRVAAVTQIKYLKKGEVLWHRGEPATHFAIVLEGVLGMYADAGGAAETLAGVCPKSEILLTALEEGAPSHLKVAAITRTDLAWIPLTVLTAVARENWTLTARIFALCVERLAHQRYLAVLMQTASVERRLALAYWQLSTVERDGTRVISAKIPQLELGELVGASREEVCRKTTLLEQSGYLLTENGRRVLHDSLRLLILSDSVPPQFLAKKLSLG